MIDPFEEFKKSSQYSSLLDIFNSIVYNQNINTPIPNTAYIYCNLTLPEYDINPKKKTFNRETTFNVNNPNIVQGTTMFYSKTQYLGCYNDINNVLYLIDIITPSVENNDFKILNEIIKIIHESINERVQEIKEELKVSSQSKLMLGDKIYDLSTKSIKLNVVDKLLHRTPPGCIHCIDGKIYGMSATNQQDIGLDAYKGEIAEKAQKIIAGYRQKYYDDTTNFKYSYKRMIEENTPIPQYSPEEIAKQGLMIAAENGRIVYMFRVDIKVHSVVSEKREIYVKLAKPVLFDNGLLIIITTVQGNVVGTKFKHKRHHYHTDEEDDICLGSAASTIRNMKINSLNDLLKLKSTIVNMLSTCNVSSMFRPSYMHEKMDELIESSKSKGLRNLVANTDI